MHTVRPMQHQELAHVYCRVARDFPPIEYPPLHKMKRHMENNAMEGHICAIGAQQAAYAFVLRGEELSKCMLFLYAVEPALRGKGVGSRFLTALTGQYQSLDGMYAEVEKAELAQTAQERRTRLRRIAFYENLGFVRVPQLHYSIYGVEMHLYFKPLARKSAPNAHEAVRDATQLYDGILLTHERRELDVHPL